MAAVLNAYGWTQKAVPTCAGCVVTIILMCCVVGVILGVSTKAFIGFVERNCWNAIALQGAMWAMVDGIWEGWCRPGWQHS
jgi:hypothetical protein